MFSKTAATFFLISIFSLTTAAQNAPTVKIEGTPAKTVLSATGDEPAQPQQQNLPPEVLAKVIAFLKATGRDASALNSPENRVRYLTDTADLLWQHDPKAARDFFATAMNEFRLVMQTLDALKQKRDTGDIDEDEMAIPLFGGGGSSDSRFYATQTVRKNLILTLAKRDATAALDFFRETKRDFSGWNDNAFDTQLAAIVAKTDPTRAYEIGKQKLDKDDFNGLDDLIINLYAKDAVKGAKLASEFVKKLRGSDFSLGSSNFYFASQFFSKAVASVESSSAATSQDKPALLSAADLRELAETLTKVLAEMSKTNSYAYQSAVSEGLGDKLKKYAPASFARLEKQAKAAEKNAVEIIQEIDEPPPPPRPVPTPAKTATAADGPGRGTSDSERQAEALMQLMKAAASPDANLSLEDVRKNLSQIKNRSQKLLLLTQFVKSFAERGDKESAKSLLADASNLQFPQPRKAMEMLQNLMLADAQSTVDPERAFATMETLVFESNGVLAALGRIGEFVNIPEFMENNEFRMGNFSRSDIAQITSLSSQFGLQKMLFNLAKADFDRTVQLTDKFDKPEVRMEAKMLIIGLLLPPEKSE